LRCLDAARATVASATRGSRTYSRSNFSSSSSGSYAKNPSYRPGEAPAGGPPAGAGSSIRLRILPARCTAARFRDPRGRTQVICPVYMSRARVERGRESATSGRARGLSGRQKRRIRQFRPGHGDRVTARRALRRSARHACGLFCRRLQFHTVTV